MRDCVRLAVRCCPQCRGSRISHKKTQFHLQQNAGKYVTRPDDREPVARTIRAIFTATDAAVANEKLKHVVKHWQSVHPMLALWAEENLSEGLTVFGLPEPHRV